MATQIRPDDGATPQGTERTTAREQGDTSKLTNVNDYGTSDDDTTRQGLTDADDEDSMMDLGQGSDGGSAGDGAGA